MRLGSAYAASYSSLQAATMVRLSNAAASMPTMAGKRWMVGVVVLGDRPMRMMELVCGVTRMVTMCWKVAARFRRSALWNIIVWDRGEFVVELHQGAKQQLLLIRGKFHYGKQAGGMA
eukprot:2732283-Amphidinium_carterae.1